MAFILKGDKMEKFTIKVTIEEEYTISDLDKQLAVKRITDLVKYRVWKGLSEMKVQVQKVLQ